MDYEVVFNEKLLGPPKVLFRDDNFLSLGELYAYQKLLHGPIWTPSPTMQTINYFSRDLYRHYKWNGDWDNVGWRDDAPPEWEDLYHRIAQHLPAHYVHWLDVKITPPLGSGTPRHRDKDPWGNGGSEKFDKALTVLLNLNTEWHDSWGGEFVTWSASADQEHNIELTEFERIPIRPGQLLIMENCWHSIAPVTEPNRGRISFILHVLKQA